MLTPAEELGLSGLSLASRVRKAFFRIPDDQLRELTQRIRDEARRRHLFYAHDGEMEVVHVMPMPITVLSEQLSYIHYVCSTLQNALKRLPDLYFADADVRFALQLPAEEEEWLKECWPTCRDNNAIFSRLDAMVDFISPMWKDSLKFVEPNLGGIGGLHMIPTAERILGDIILPVLRQLDKDLHLELGRDIRELLMQEILDHLQALGRPGNNICFVEPKYAGSGPEEQEDLANYFHEQYGMKVLHADPAELRLEGGEVRYDGERVDLAYRDYSVFDLIELRKQGADIEPMRALFRQNRVISSIAAELDQKSCWEVFTDARFTHKYFNGDERQVFRRHILWTRIVADRSTLLPEGQSGDLLTYIRSEQEHLVLKPNRSYGGDRVAIGHLMTRSEWEAELECALADPARWVVQELASIPVGEFPVIDPEARIHFEPFYTVMGFAATKYGLSTLGRASQKQVVNVALRGGLCAVMQGRPPAKLHGPV